MHMSTVKTLLPMLALSATIAATAAPPLPTTTVLRQAVPSATVDLRALAVTQAFTASMQGVGAVVVLSAENVGIGGPLLLSPSSTVYAAVFEGNADGSTLPAGQYRVRFNFTNLFAPATVSLNSNTGAAASCALTPSPAGPQAVQSCDLLVVSSGAAFRVAASRLSGVSQSVLASVQVFKEH